MSGVTILTGDALRQSLVCVGCLKDPEEIDGLQEMASQVSEEGERYYRDVRDYVVQEEGTLNRYNGHFLCDACYIAWGMPTSPTGWKAP